MSKARDLADFISTGSILSDGTIESTEISGVTADATEINKLDGLTADTAELNKLDGVTATTAELNKLAGTTATTSDFDKLSNVTASATELNYMSGATSSIQDQLDNISVTSGSLTKSFTNGETASITLSSALSTAPVVGVTKEVAQTGISSKGAWDVNATASNYELHNTAYDTTLTPSSTLDVSTSSDDSKYADVSSQEMDPQGVHFKTDGTKMYIVGYNNDEVRQYSLSTAWDASTASYDSKSYSVTSQEQYPNGLFFKPDGTKLYVAGEWTNSVYQYSLSTAWDVSTVSYDSVSLSASSQDGNIQGITFSADGTKMYLVGYNNRNIYQYNLSTAWDLSTASYSVSFYVGNESSYPREADFNSDGTVLLVLEDNAHKIVQYNLSTAYDISTATFSNLEYTLPIKQQAGIAISSDDDKVYVTNRTNGRVDQFSLGSSNSFTLGTGSFASTDVGKRIQGNGGDVILTSTAGAYDTTGGSDFTDTSTIASGSWTMHGLKSAGATDGLTLSNFVDGYGLSTLSNDSSSYSQSAQTTSSSTMIQFNSDGTKVYFGVFSTDSIYQHSLSTAWNLSTASYDSVSLNVSSQNTYPTDFVFGDNGLKLYFMGQSGRPIYQYNLSTAFDLSTASYASKTIDISSQDSNMRSINFKSDGTMLFAYGASNNKIYAYNLSTAWDISTATYASVSFDHSAQTTREGKVTFSDDGLVMAIVDGLTDMYVYNLSTAWDISTAVFSNSQTADLNVFDVYFKPDGTKTYFVNDTTVYQYSSGQGTVISASQYHIAATNSGGQISTEYWTDINSMTADQSLGDGEAYYAVSTDDRTTWSVAKASDGVRPIVRDNAGTWQYNSDAGSVVGYAVASATYDSKSYTNPVNGSYGFTFANNGTKLYTVHAYFTDDYIAQHTLSTAYDISTASYDSVTFNLTSQQSDPMGVIFSSDGTKFWITGSSQDEIHQYSMTTAFDISTASYDSVSFSFTSQDTAPNGIEFNSDGTKLFMLGQQNDKVYQYSLSTAYDISTASYDSVDFSVNSQETTPNGLSFNSDGTEMYVGGYNGAIYIYALSTAFDLSTASYSSQSFSITSQSSTVFDIDFNADGTSMVVHGSSNTLYQYTTSNVSYTTSTTWTNATTNDEFYALQEALGATEFNRMDKTQLDAVADGSHFTLGDTLDLAIALKQDTASASLPTSDGVSINYDAQALNQGAVLGTDYDYDFPDSTTVRITSNAAQNLKIRVV